MKKATTLFLLMASVALFTSCGPGAISADGSGTVKDGAEYSNGRRSGDLAKYLDDTESYSKTYTEGSKSKFLDATEKGGETYVGEYTPDGKLFSISFSKRDVKNNEVVKSEYYWTYFRDDKPVLIKISRDEYPGDNKLIASKDYFFIKDGEIVECYRDKGEGKNVSGMQRIETKRYALDGDAMGYGKKLLADVEAAKTKLAATKFPDEILKDLEAQMGGKDSTKTE